MNRFSFTLVIAIVLAVAGPAPSFAQSVLHNVFTTDEVILRVIQDQTWNPSQTANGLPAVSERHQVIGGVFQEEMQPSAAALYEKHHIQEVYIYTAQFESPIPAHSVASTLMEMRVLVFPDEPSAQNYLGEAYDGQVQSVINGEVPDLQFASIDPLPSFESSLVGWTHLADYYDTATGEFQGSGSAVRYLAQSGNIVASARVNGPMVDYNFDLAHSLLVLQVACINATEPCAPVSITQATPQAWDFSTGALTFTNTDGQTLSATVTYPVDSPTRAPEMSVSFGSDQVGTATSTSTSSTASDAVASGQTSATVSTDIGIVVSDPAIEPLEIITQLAFGDPVVITGEPMTDSLGITWYPISTPEGTTGWLPSYSLAID